MSKYDPNFVPPAEVTAKAVDVARWMEQNECTEFMGLALRFAPQRTVDASAGTGAYLQAAALHRQVEALKLERDQLRAALRLADALRNQERGMDKPERRKWRRT